MVNAPEGFNKVFFKNLLFFNKFVVKEHNEKPHLAIAAAPDRHTAPNITQQEQSRQIQNKSEKSRVK